MKLIRHKMEVKEEVNCLAFSTDYRSVLVVLQSSYEVIRHPTCTILSIDNTLLYRHSNENF